METERESKFQVNTFNQNKLCYVIYSQSQQEAGLRQCIHHGRRVLGSVVEQTGQGVQIPSSLKVVTQIDKVAKKAFVILAFLGLGIEYRRWNIVLQLDTPLVKPILDIVRYVIISICNQYM